MLWFFIYFICYMLTRFVYLNPQKKIAKRKFDTSPFLSYYIFGMNKASLRIYLLTSIHVLNFVFWICVICFSDKIGMSIWLEIIISRSSAKGVPWKFWLDPRFSRNLKLKWILKWLPLDRGCFKFYFIQKGKVC